MHTVLYGPPGTGKTEIAKILGNIYSKTGILKNNIILILFFNFIASKYVPTLPSYFVNETLESMKRKFTSFSEAS